MVVTVVTFPLAGDLDRQEKMDQNKEHAEQSKCR
jgi:hypothetical protein